MSDKDFSTLKQEVEAILFSYGDWISKKHIKETLEIDSDLLIDNALKELKEKFKEGFSFHIEQTEDSLSWKMALKEDFSLLVSDVVTGTEIPQSVLKVLSVIAYEQPVTKTRLSEIIGRSVKQDVSYLYRNKFLSYEKYGIGKYYKVTKKFYDYFKLDESQDFREEANKSMTTFLEQESTGEEKEEKTESVSEEEDKEENK